MTVITKPISENKPPEKPQEVPLVVSVDDKAVVQCKFKEGGPVPPVDGAPSTPISDVDTWLYENGRRQRRVSATTSVCVFVATLFLMSGAIIGSVYIYRQSSHNQMSRLRVWCGVPFERNTLRLPPHHSKFNWQKSSHWPSPFNSKDDMFNEQFDLDLATNSYEEIYVPDFGINRNGRFVHDWKENLTAIIDLTGRKCYVFNLNTENVATPRKIYHVLKKMWRAGFYKGKMAVVRETMEVVRPPISNVEALGTYIARRCEHFTTYRLVKTDRYILYDHTQMRDKRQIDDGSVELQTYEQTDHHFTVVEFAGKGIIEYTVIDE